MHKGGIICKCTFCRKFLLIRPVARIFHGDAYLKNRDQIINIGMIGHASTKDIGVWGEGEGDPGACSPRKKMKPTMQVKCITI